MCVQLTVRDTVPAVGQIRATVRLHLGRSAARRVQERVALSVEGPLVVRAMRWPVSGERVQGVTYVSTYLHVCTYVCMYLSTAGSLEGLFGTGF